MYCVATNVVFAYDVGDGEAAPVLLHWLLRCTDYLRLSRLAAEGLSSHLLVAKILCVSVFAVVPSKMIDDIARAQHCCARCRTAAKAKGRAQATAHCACRTSQKPVPV